MKMLLCLFEGLPGERPSDGKSNTPLQFHPPLLGLLVLGMPLGHATVSGS